MRQNVKKEIKRNSIRTKNKRSYSYYRLKKNSKNHPKYGTSKLEQDFAINFLDKLGIEYVYQYEAKDIKRYYDFYLPKHKILIEVDGGFYHADPRVVDQNKLNAMQKHNKRVDEIKNRWASLNGIPLIRIWEYDIRNNPDMVMKMLKERLYIQDKKIILKENKKKRGKVLDSDKKLKKMIN